MGVLTAYPESARTEALQLLAQGYSCAQAGKQVGATKEAVRYWARAAGFKYPAQRKNRTPPKAKPANLTPAPYARGLRWGEAI